MCKWPFRWICQYYALVNGFVMLACPEEDEPLTNPVLVRMQDDVDVFVKCMVFFDSENSTERLYSLPFSSMN